VIKSPDEYIAIGKIGAPFGIKGWTKIHSFTDWVGNIFEYDPWYLEEGDDWNVIKITEGRAHGKGLIAKFSGYDTPETVRVLTGKVIAIKRSQLPPLKKGDYYWSDLEGLTVINKDGKVLGKIAYLIETGANDVLVVKNEKEHAIPYLPGTVVLSVDLESRIMHVDWELI
jgi:16S rRNA processing protein RimM